MVKRGPGSHKQSRDQGRPGDSRNSTVSEGIREFGSGETIELPSVGGYFLETMGTVHTRKQKHAELTSIQNKTKSPEILDVTTV